MNEERLKFWADAVAKRTTLGEITIEEIHRVPEQKGDVYYIAGLIVAASGQAEPEEETIRKMGKIISDNIVCEALRRRYASKRPRLFFLRDLPADQLHQKMEIPEKEFMIGLSYTIREKTGLEMTADEAALAVSSYL